MKGEKIMGLFGNLLNSNNNNSTDIQMYVNQIMNAYTIIRDNADTLNCKVIMIGPYWVEYNNSVIFGSAAIAVGTMDYEDYCINPGTSQNLGLEISCLNGRTYAQLRIGENHTKKQKANIINQVYEKLKEIYPENLIHYDRNQSYILIPT